MKRYRYITTKLLLLLMLLMTGAGEVWAVDDTFTVKSGTTTTLGETIYTGTYTSLTLGVSPDALSNTFAVSAEDDAYQICGTQAPKYGEGSVGTGQVPDRGSFFKIVTSKPGEFVFRIKLNKTKRVHFRKSDGTEINTKENDDLESSYVSWTVKIDEAGTYYLYGDGTKLPLFNYTFTRKIPTGITSIPYHTDFGSNIEPFDDGNKTNGTNISNVFTINSVAPNSGTAIARFNGVHTLANTERVTLSFTAYHGFYNKGGTSKVTLYNSDDRPLISYTYNKQSGYITEVSFDGVQAEGFAEFNARSNTGGQGANGLASANYPFSNNAADNPVVTMTFLGTGQATFNITRTYGSLNTTYNAALTTVKKDLAYIKIEDTSDNADRGLGIDNLSITSKLASLDYETEVVDWTTSVSGRYTPVILTESTNHYLSVNQSQRNDGGGGATLTSTSLSGKIAAGQDFTLEFDMKVGNNNRNGSSGPPAFTVFAANNSNYIFEMKSSNNTTGWQINGTESVTLEGTGVTNGTDITSLTWYHYKISKTNGYTYVTITSADGSTTYMRKGISNSAGGLGNLQYITGKSFANFAIDNIQVVPYASTTFIRDGKDETYVIMGEGALPQVDEGRTIKIEYGTTDQVQMTMNKGASYGAYALDANTGGTYSRAYSAESPTATSLPGLGTFYKFTPVYAGKLTISGWVDNEDKNGVVNNVTLQRGSDGTVIATYLPSNSNLFSNQLLDVELAADTEYYLYASTPKTANCQGSNTSYPTLYLTGFKFTQSARSRQIDVADLLYAGEKKNGNLDRIIPGFELEFRGGDSDEDDDDDNVKSSNDRKYLTFQPGSSMKITLRQNGYSAKISKVTLLVSEIASGTPTVNGTTVTSPKTAITISPEAGDATLTCASGTFTITGFVVGYTGTDDQSFRLWLNEEKTNIGTLAIGNSHIMRVPGDGKAFTNSISFADDDANKWWVENTDYLHTSSNTSVATINTDGTNGQLLQAGSATITTTFEETDFFNEKSISYTVDNVLRNDDVTYTIDVTTGKILRVGAYADAASTTLLLNGSHTSDVSFTFGTTSEKQYTRVTSDGTVALKNETANNITINTLQTFSSNVVAWLYYEGQESNYSVQVHFQNFASGDVKGFRVLDIGDPIDPIELTDTYELDTSSKYVWTNGTLITNDASHLGGTFDVDKGSFTVKLKDDGSETTLPKVTHSLTRKTGTPSDGYPNTKDADANIFIATPPDADTYKIWDMTASVTGANQMDSRWGWNGYGHYYQTSLPEYLPVLNNAGKTLVGNEGLLVKGDMRYHTGTNGLRLNLTKANACLKFPVKAGMEVKVVMASSSADMTHVIKNVTDLTGVSTEKLYIENPGISLPTTAYFLAESDGVVEVQSMDRAGAYVKSITLQVPKIHFEEETVVVKNEVADVINVPYNTGDATLTYTIGGSYDLDGNSTSALATIANANVGKVSVAGTNEGYVVVNVTNPSATGVQPKNGSFRLYMIDFKFDPATDALNLEGAANGEVTFNRRPTGYNKVISPVKYTMSVVSDAPRGRLTQTTNSDPKLTTYQLTTYSPGVIRVTATTGRITTYCDVTVSGGDNLYAEVAPIRLLSDLPTEGEPATRYFTMALPTGLNHSYTSYTVDVSGDVTCDGATTIDVSETKTTKISNIAGSGGAIRVTATDNNNTDGDKTDDKVAQFVLTIPYSASAGKKWDFYRMKNYESSTKYGLKIGVIDEYDGDDNQINDDVDITGTNGWTTADTHWTKIFRKGKEQPRWSYTHSMRGYNAFVIEETAGLIIETGPKGFYTDNPHQPTEWAYNHIGLHNNASITIPKLKAGDYIALNLGRVTSNNGALLSVSNVKDLAGTTVDHTFSISRSQDDYSDGGNPATDASGARIIPGYYTFQAAADGDVTITLADEGYLDILSVEIYNNGYSAYSSTRDSKTGYNYTMKNIVTDGTYTTPPATFLMDTGDQEEVSLALCHYMWSTGVGPADYILEDQIGNLDATLENVEWVSDGGAIYNKGRITVNDGYGKMLVRMNNYTAEGRYLIGYTPTYALTVGRKPHQDYPYTWNFENISGGAVKGKGNNAYNNISSDPYTWTGLGYETYQLDTRTSGGSLYVPGATLVTADRSLGKKGTIAELNAANLGCDEFNGLGFTGQIKFRTALQASEEPATPAALTDNGSLLEYAINTSNREVAADEPTSADTKQYWAAGDGLIKFGQTGKRVTSAIAENGAAYQMDGGNSKNLLLKPERALKEGDQIYLKGYSTSNVQKSGFSFYAGANDNAYDALLTLNWSSSTDNDEQEITYTIAQGDGLAGRDSLYLFRAGKQYTVFLTEVRITTTDETTPTIAERALTCVGAVTVTIPDLIVGHYVYIKSSEEPNSVPSNLTKILDTDDGTDGYDVATNVYKYKVNAAGNADIVFGNGTEIYRIGVTNIMKPMKQVGEGDAWATESRDHAIDYTQTGHFTVNDIKANTVTAKTYTGNKVTVRLNEKTDAMPAETGMVLKLKLAYKEGDDDGNGGTMTAEQASTATTNAATDFAKAKGGNQVPLFYPPYSATILNSSAVGFGGTEGNLMMANLDSRVLTQERETGVLDKDGDSVDDSGAADGDYTRFIFAERYMKWTKIDNDVQHTTGFTNSGNVPVFYRMHLYNGTEAAALSSTEATLNTLGANKAYMLIRSGNVPDALWNSGGGGSAKRFIGIEGVSDMDEIIDAPNTSDAPNNDAIYSLSGQLMGDDETVLAPGIYIRNGKKFLVK